MFHRRDSLLTRGAHARDLLTLSSLALFLVGGVTTHLRNADADALFAAPSMRLTGGTNPTSVALADLEGDGERALVAVRGDTRSVLLGAGGGAFGATAQAERGRTATRGSMSDRYFFGYISQWSIDFAGGVQPQIATDDSGSVYVVSSAVWKYTNAGVFLTSWAGAGGQGFDSPSIAVGPNGIVYVLDQGSSSVQAFSTMGTPLGQWGGPGMGPGQFSCPTGIATDDSGEVYVIDCSPPRVQRFTSSGDFLAEWGSQGDGDGEFMCPTGIAVDHLGHVYVADDGYQRIQKFTTSGEHVATWSVPGFAVAVDSANDVYVLDDLTAQVVKLGPGGDELDRWGGFGRADGQFREPTGVATDPDGNVFIADRVTGKIQKFGMATRWFITATAGSNGAIEPAGVTAVAQGTDRTYAITPDLGYQVADLHVDGISMGALSGYTFANVIADHTIEASFATLVGWPRDPALNLPICVAPNIQELPCIVTDGAHGAIVVWQDRGIGVYAQRVDALARLLWPLRGVCVTAGAKRYLERVAPDGAGGAVVLWADYLTCRPIARRARRPSARRPTAAGSAGPRSRRSAPGPRTSPARETPPTARCGTDSARSTR
jgi:hypothetical protein